MKWLLAMVSKGRDVSEFFSDVVKNMAVRSVEVKKMVYIYLVHYADNDAQCRELALLSINSFQNDLRGSNQVCVCVRAWHGQRPIVRRYHAKSGRDISNVEKKKRNAAPEIGHVFEEQLSAAGLSFPVSSAPPFCSRRSGPFRNVLSLFHLDSSSKRSLFA